MQQHARRLNPINRSTRLLDYLIAAPDGDGPWPLVLFLHGMGERGNDIDLVKIHGPPKLIEAGKTFDAVVVSPQCPDDTIWSCLTDALAALVDEIEREYPIDPDRVYLTGVSMGGFGVLSLAARSSDRFAAVVPICGGGSRIEMLALRRVPMWFFHGGADDDVPPGESRRLVEHLNAADGETAKLTIYDGVGHDSWTQTYEDEAMWRWLLSQRRA